MKAIELHIHGGFGICFDNAGQDKIREFASLAYEYGIEAFCPTLTGDNAENLSEKIEIIKDAKESQENIKNEAKIIGVHLEGTFLNKNKCGIQDPKMFLEPTVENFKKIAKKNEDIIKIVVIAPENQNSNNLISYLKSKNIKVHYGHTTTDTLQGADGICHLYNAMEPISHKKSSLALKALLDKEIYTELIADGIHINQEMLKLTFSVHPKNKIILISDAIPSAHSNTDWVEFCGKKIYKNGKDENGTLAGSVKFLPEIGEYLLKNKILNIDEIETMLYKNPKDYLKLIL